MKLESRVRLDNAPTTCCGNRCRSALWRQSESLTNLNDFHASRITVFLTTPGHWKRPKNGQSFRSGDETKLYDRRKEQANLSEIEGRIAFE